MSVMFERYTVKARRVVFFARYESSQFGSLAIEPEHILLGVLREDPAIVLHFADENLSADAVRAQVEKASVMTEEKISTSVELPLSPAAKKVLVYAHMWADALSHQHIGTEHLLLGLLDEEASAAAKVLRQNGIEIEEVHKQVKELNWER